MLASTLNSLNKLLPFDAVYIAPFIEISQKYPGQRTALTNKKVSKFRHWIFSFLNKHIAR